MSGDNWMNQFSWMHDMNKGLGMAMQKQYAQMGVIANIENGLGAAVKRITLAHRPTIALDILRKTNIPNHLTSSITLFEAAQKVNRMLDHHRNLWKGSRTMADLVFQANKHLSNTINHPKGLLEAFHHENRVLGMHKQVTKEYRTLADLHYLMQKVNPIEEANGMINAFHRQQELFNKINMPLNYSAVLETTAWISDVMAVTKTLASDFLNIEDEAVEDDQQYGLIERAKELLLYAGDTTLGQSKKMLAFLIAIYQSPRTRSALTSIGDLNNVITLIQIAIHIFTLSENAKLRSEIDYYKHENDQTKHENLILKSGGGREVETINALRDSLNIVLGSPHTISLISNCTTKLRSTQFNRAKIRATIPAGKVVTVIEVSDKWLRIIYITGETEFSGWVLKEHFEKY